MKDRGFTLIELLAVLTILSIVIAIGAMNVTDVSKKRREEDYKNVVSMIEKNTELLLSENNDIYIEVTDKLTTLNSKCKITYQTLIDNKLIDETEKDPRTGEKINPESYIIISLDDDYDLMYKFININDENSNQESVDYCILGGITNSNFSFEVDNLDWSLSKNITISYPEGYTNEYSIDSGSTWNTYSGPVLINENTTILARTTYNGNYIDSASYTVTKIDKTAPVLTSVTGNPTSWTTSATLTINASDNESGLASEPYSFDNGTTWQAENTKTYTSNTSGIIIKVKDALGNIYTNTSINITKVDSVTPTLTMTAGTYYLTNTNNVYSVNFGASSGTVNCVNTSRSNAKVTTFKSINTLGPNAIKCKATSNAGKSVSKTVTYNMNHLLDGTGLSVTGNGYKSGTSIVLPKSSTQFGPYIPINAGCYQVIYYGNNLNTYPSGYRSYSTLSGPQATFTLLSLNYLSSDSNYYIKVSSNYNTIEFVLENSGSSTITVNNIRILYRGAVSACPSS